MAFGCDQGTDVTASMGVVGTCPEDPPWGHFFIPAPEKVLDRRKGTVPADPAKASLFGLKVVPPKTLTMYPPLTHAHRIQNNSNTNNRDTNLQVK